jgi:proteinaceous RNase P
MMVYLDIQINDSKLKLFKKFKQWLHINSDIDIVIDGANVGYFNNRPNKGNSINFKQIDNIRTELTKMGNNVVIILHKRHTKEMTKFQNMLYNNWIKNNQVYITPVGINDDIFWLYTSLYSSAYIITNDRMRDHHFNIDYNKIVKWKKKNIINYEIQKKSPKLFFPKKYSETFQNINKYTWFFPFNDKENKLQWFFTKIE